MKKTKGYRAGKKGQHTSLLVTDTFTPPFGDTDIKAMSGGAGNAKEQLEKMIGWTEALLDIASLPNGTELKLSEIDNIDDPLAVAGLHARQRLVLVKKMLLADDHASAFNALLSAIPALMNANTVQYENLILAGKSRTTPAHNEKAALRDKNIATAKPIYEQYIAEGKSKNRAAELTSTKLGIPKETIRGYFKK